MAAVCLPSQCLETPSVTSTGPMQNTAMLSPDRQARLTFFGRHGLAYLLMVVGFLAVAVAAYWPLPEAAFRSDNSPVSWLSSAQLWTASVLSLRLVSEGVLTRRLGGWLFVALAGLAFDEQFMFHEQWKFGCADWFSACRYAWVTELPMLSVGVLGLGTMVVLHRTVSDPRARVQLWSAYLMGAFALFIDLFSMQWLVGLYEEGFEVISEAIFMGILLGLRNSSAGGQAKGNAS